MPLIKLVSAVDSPEAHGAHVAKLIKEKLLKHWSVNVIEPNRELKILEKASAHAFREVLLAKLASLLKETPKPPPELIYYLDWLQAEGFSSEIEEFYSGFIPVIAADLDMDYVQIFE